MSLDENYYQLIREIFPEVKGLAPSDDALKQLIEFFISDLAAKDQQVIRLRFGLTNGSCMTLQQIGNILGITRERVRQLEKRALRRLKHPVRADKLRQYVEVGKCQK